MLKKWTKAALLAATAALVLAAGTFISCSDDDEVYEEIPEFDIMDGILQHYYGTGGDVTIPDGVRIIGSNAFEAKAITSVVIPSGVVQIQSLAFFNCSELTSVTLPVSVREIADDAFWYCDSLKNLTYTGTLKDWCSIQNGALQSGLTCFVYGGISIESIKLSDGTDLKTAKTLEIPMGVTAIADYVFYNCWQLESVTIPASATFIGDYAFSGCSSLKSVTIPTGLTTISGYAFSNCSSLESITIPAGVTYIAPYAFKDCQSLESVEFKSQDNWSYSSSVYLSANVSDPSKNAANLKNTTYPGWGESGLYKKN
ncbi:MAG: leucine-rich repeat domain-containing protein [Treponema sp.]|nr:leucine-rich repeat domain-containing protein [Treponema sp.]